MYNHIKVKQLISMIELHILRMQKMNNYGISVLYPDVNLDLFFFMQVLTSVAGPIDLDMCVYGIRNVQKSVSIRIYLILKFYFTLSSEPLYFSFSYIFKKILLESKMTVYQYFDINVSRFSLQIFYEQGFTALMFFIAFALGIGLVIGAVCLFLMIKRKRAVQSKSFTQVVI